MVSYVCYCHSRLVVSYITCGVSGMGVYMGVWRESKELGGGTKEGVEGVEGVGVEEVYGRGGKGGRRQGGYSGIVDKFRKIRYI